MADDRAIKRFIDVEITKENPGVSAAGFGTEMVITDSPRVTTTTRVQTSTTVQAVIDFFGTGSEEALAADAHFNQDPFLVNQPEQLQFGRYVDAVSAAVLECGNTPETDFEVWKLVSDGEFGITVDAVLDDVAALDFTSVTSMDDVATVIDTGLTGAGCVFRVNRFVITSDTTGASSTITLLQTVAAPAGTDISGSDYMDGDVIVGPTNLGGSILSQGQIAEVFATAYAAIKNVDNDWATMGAVKKFRDTTDAEDMADAIEGDIKTFHIASNDANVFVSGDTSTFSYYLKNLNYKRTSVFAYDNATLYPDLSWTGQQIPKTPGGTNWAYKQLAGIAEGAAVNIPPMTLSQSQIDAALDVNANVYTTTSGADFVYFGTMGGGRNADKDGEYIDIIRDIDFLTARISEGMLNMITTLDILPFTDGGITIADNKLKEMLKIYGADTGILVESTIQTFFPKASDVSSVNKDDRILPDGTFNAQLQGAINTVTIRGKVFV